MRRSVVAAAAVALAAAWCAAAQLSQSYYASTCPNVDTLVRGAVTQKLQETFNAAPGTLRLFFHDCFVRVRARFTGLCLAESRSPRPSISPIDLDWIIPGLRRVGAAVGPRRRAQRGRRHDAVPGRAGPHHPRQGCRRRRPALRQQGLLRRHPRARRPRRRLAGTTTDPEFQVPAAGEEEGTSLALAASRSSELCFPGETVMPLWATRRGISEGPRLTHA